MAENSDINAALNCMGYGYGVKVLVNGKDIGIKGGMSEAKRLFSVEHSMKSEASPEFREKLFVLNKGENTIHIEYNRTGDQTSRLTVDLVLEGQEQPVARLETTDASGVFDQTFTA